MKRIALLIVLAGGCSTGPVAPPKPVEICANGKDDDGNGLADCQDLDCSGQAGCPVVSGTGGGGGNFGTCKHCGSVCVKQSECLTVDYQNDSPAPECVGGKCQLLNANVQVRFELDTTSLTGSSAPLRSLNTRFVSKRAIDGSPATCVTVRAAAMGKTEADANQIEKSGLFNLRGYDVSPVTANPGQPLSQPFVNVGTGRDFLIWTEVWAGQVATATKLPSGKRISWGCFEDGPAVAEVLPSDHCSGATDGGICRTIKVKLVNGPE